MATKLSRAETVEAGDGFVIDKNINGDFRLLDQQGMIDFINQSVGYVKPATQYFAPSSTGFNIQVNSGSDIHLILTPIAAYAAGTITLPNVQLLSDKQTLIVTTTQAVTTLTITLNGASAIFGAPTTMAANSFFTLKYDLVMKTWYRVG
jgi:hypothetical protein